MLKQTQGMPADTGLTQDEMSRLRRMMRALNIDEKRWDDKQARDAMCTVFGMAAGQLEGLAEDRPQRQAAPAIAGMVGQDAKDAARYRWLTETTGLRLSPPGGVAIRDLAKMNAHIDAAMTAQQAQAPQSEKVITQAGFIKPSVEEAACTCPSGDGSLRWPCPSHPPQSEPAQAAADASCQKGGAAC